MSSVNTGKTTAVLFFFYLKEQNTFTTVRCLFSHTPVMKIFYFFCTFATVLLTVLLVFPPSGQQDCGSDQHCWRHNGRWGQ